MPPRNKRKVKSKGKKIHTGPPSAFVGRESNQSGRLGDKSSETGPNVPSSIAINVAGASQNVRNDGQNILNADTRITTTSTSHRSDTPNIVESDFEALNISTAQSRGFFHQARNFVVANPTMVDKPTTNIYNQVAGDREVKAKKLLSKHIIQGAARDSSARDPPPHCHPGTRISINKRIMVWFYDDKKQELVLWIYGPAGVGKSAIVQTIADTLAAAECLGASVFFSRPNGRNNSHSVFITIAYQLTVHIPAYCAFISERLASDPELVNKGMKEQFKTFIVEPFAEKKIGAGGKSWGILLDGLDELDEKTWQREIIRLVTNFAREHPGVPLVWVISSRPEPHILTTFKAKQLASIYREEYIPVDSPEACQDVERYLRSSFDTVCEDFHHIIPPDWPKETKLTQLAHAASGLFAFADVAVRYIGDARHADPVTRLDDVLAVIEHSRVDSGEEQPFAHLDALYTRILASIPRKTWPVTQQVLVAIYTLSGGTLGSIKGLSVILGIELSKIYTAINDLYSILDISLGNVHYPLDFHHASFADFLGEPTRSMEFYTPFEDSKACIYGCGARIWLDFQKGSPRGPEYLDRWRKYALRFHFDVNVADNVAKALSIGLFSWVHAALEQSLRTKRDLTPTETSPQHWDQVVEMMCQVEPDTLSVECPSTYDIASVWFDVWKIRRENLSDRQIVHEIKLEQLQLDHLWWPENNIIHSLKVSNRYSDKDGHVKYASVSNEIDKFMSGLKHFQRCHPTLPVLICGNRGNQFAIFIYEYTEDDFTERPLHARVREELDFEEYRYQGGYCIPYSDDV